MGFGARDPLDNPLDPVYDLERRMRSISADMLQRIADVDRDWPDDPAVPDLACEMADGSTSPPRSPLSAYGWPGR